VDDLQQHSKLDKKLAKKYDAFLASEAISSRSLPANPPSSSPTPRNKITKACSITESQLKKVLCLGAAIGYIEVTIDQVLANVVLTYNFLVSLLKKSWQNAMSLHIKNVMDKPIRLY
ncbi:60S ribosomal protein L1-B, partial [Leucoagaricus sp. SymC.cos]